MKQIIEQLREDWLPAIAWCATFWLVYCFICLSWVVYLSFIMYAAHTELL